MAQVEITVNARPYKVTCEDGQEQRLTELARYLDRHIEELVESLGQIGEARLLLLSALTVCDELFETRAQLFARKQQADAPDTPESTDMGHIAEQLDAARGRIEALATRLS